MEEKELFQDYELKNWELSPRIYKIIGAAVVVHLFAFVVIGQFNLFGTKACDSPYVNKVCQVLDTAYMASVFLGTDMEFSSRDYDKTEINEEDITYIDVSDQFTYPSGYFAIANPEQAPLDSGIMPGGTMDFSTGNIPGIPNPIPPLTLDPSKPAVLPTPNPNVIDGNLPTSPLGNNPPVAKIPKNFPRTKTPPFPPIKKPKNIPNTSPGVLPSDKELANKEDKNKPNSNTTADNTKPKPEDANSEESKLFNKKPLEDFGEKYGQKILNKEVDINAPFTIEIKAGLDEFGKFINPKMSVKDGSDPKMVEVAKEAISAFGDSQLLITLYNAGVKNVTITFSQDKDNMMAIIKSEAPNEPRAKSMYSAVNTALKLIKLKEGSDEESLMKKAQFSTEGKNYIINFLIPNEEKTQLIEKNLRSLQEKLKNKQPNSGVAETNSKVVTSAK